jgi:DNA-binding transcriptional ArsR family regulator
VKFQQEREVLMTNKMTDQNPAISEEDLVFESAAELFGLLSTPVRLKIISAVCQGERNVSELLAQIDTTQPNMSQHLATLYRAGVLGRRREGTQIYYRLQSERVATLCRAVCTQVATELDGDASVAATDRLLRALHR